MLKLADMPSFLGGGVPDSDQEWIKHTKSSFVA